MRRAHSDSLSSLRLLNEPEEKFCGGCGIQLTAVTPAVPRTIRQAEAERRQLTVLFGDLVGSTELSGRLDPEDMGQVIHTYLDCCAAAIRRWEGYVARFMGDGILAYFGFPRAHEDDAERAVRAGLELTEAVARLTFTGSTPRLLSCCLVVRRVHSLPVVLLISYRSKFVPAWGDQAHVTGLPLNRLSRSQGRAIIERVSGKGLPSEVLEQIVTRTDGVPLFIEELTKTVTASGLLHESGNRYELIGPLPPLAIPQPCTAR